MKKKLVFIVGAGMMIASCTHHYQVTGVSRSRVLIDKK